MLSFILHFVGFVFGLKGGNDSVVGFEKNRLCYIYLFIQKLHPKKLLPILKHFCKILYKLILRKKLQPLRKEKNEFRNQLER